MIDNCYLCDRGEEVGLERTTCLACYRDVCDNCLGDYEKSLCAACNPLYGHLYEAGTPLAGIGFDSEGEVTMDHTHDPEPPINWEVDDV